MVRPHKRKCQNPFTMQPREVRSIRLGEMEQRVIYVSGSGSIYVSKELHYNPSTVK
jgi:hypothetical protein